MAKTIKAVRSEQLSSSYDDRFVIVDLETGEILDDAQGYGYKSAQKAHIGYNYRNKQSSKPKKRRGHSKEIAVYKWLKRNSNVEDAFYDAEFMAAKYPGEYEGVTTAYAKDILESNPDVDFSAKTLVWVWNNQDTVKRWMKGRV